MRASRREPNWLVQETGNLNDDPNKMNPPISIIGGIKND